MTNDKSFATLQALAVLVGVAVEPLEGGAFLVSRWTLQRQVDSLDELTRFLAQMGVRP